MIRVLHFADLVNRYDFIDTIIRNANPSKFKMMVCTLSDTSNIIFPDYKEAGISHWVLHGDRRSDYPVIGLKLAQLLEREKIDLIHTHHYDQGLIGWLATRLYPKTRLILGRHYSDSIYRLRNGWKQKSLIALEQMMNGGATRIIVPSSYIGEILIKWQGVNHDKVDVIPYGFESAKYADPSPENIQRLRKDLGLNGHFVIGTFGRLHEEKGHRFLLPAIQQLKSRFPHLLLLVVGEGPERNAIAEQIQAAGLEDMVQLLGWRQDAMQLMAAADIVVQPTLQEAFSQVMIEALWMKKPLIITEVSGSTDIIKNE
ncbi:glycosyltransferase [Phormidium pseudopriestleyi]|nr:glycosyltransferase [Phormidium pseudopriestleyi]